MPSEGWSTAALVTGIATGAAAGAAACAYYAQARAATQLHSQPPQQQPTQQPAQPAAPAWFPSDTTASGTPVDPATMAACSSAPRAVLSDYPTAERVSEPIVVEQLTRNLQLFGEGGQARIRRSLVVVVGVGGVGSHAAHMLLRSGVGRLRLVDFDQVTLSSLNRHAVATRADVGLPKTDVLRAHLRRIFPEAYIEACNRMYDKDSSDELLEGNPDYGTRLARHTRVPTCAHEALSSPRLREPARRDPRPTCVACYRKLLTLTPLTSPLHPCCVYSAGLHRQHRHQG